MAIPGWNSWHQAIPTATTAQEMAMDKETGPQIRSIFDGEMELATAPTANSPTSPHITQGRGVGSQAVSTAPRR